MAATQPEILEHVGARLLREALGMAGISQHGGGVRCCSR